ncbi:MAG: hypothetical protein Q9169_003085 [Polycauliona sp. 2 TL-2023]
MILGIRRSRSLSRFFRDFDEKEIYNIILYLLTEIIYYSRTSSKDNESTQTSSHCYFPDRRKYLEHHFNTTIAYNTSHTMRSNTLSSSLLAIYALTLPTTYAFKLSTYSGEGCRSASVGQWIGGPDQGCQEPLDFGVAQSVVISSTGPVDKNFYTVFFDSPDCNPDTEVKNGKGHFDDGCFTGKYGSFEVWDVTAK